MKKQIIYMIGLLIIGLTNSHAAPINHFAAHVYGTGNGTSDGGIGSTSATSSSNIFAAEASLINDSYTPLLRARSVSVNPDSEDAVVGATSTAYQVFTSSSAQTITLNLSLHGTVSHSSENSSFILSSLSVISGSNFSISTSSSGPGCSFFKPNLLGSFLCGSRVGFSQLQITDGEQTLADTITFDVVQGEQFAVFGQLRTHAFGGSADAFNTFSMSFEDDSSLSAASVSAVPVPAAAWLFISGIIGICSVARRRPA